jgi:multiple sugar transport system permease protein
VTSAGRPPLRGLSGQHASRGALVVFLGPFVLLFAAFFVAPIAYAVVQSFFAPVRDSAFAPPREAFVGFANYLSVLQDPVFRSSIVHVLLFGIGPGLLLIAVALGVALLIDARRPGLLTRTFRLMVFAPYAVPAVIGAITWGFLYAPGTSPVLAALSGLGFNLDPASSLVWSIGNVAIWTYAGFNALIFLSALSTIDPSLFEAASIDGAGPLRTAISIKLPLLRPSIVLALVFNIIGTFQLFTEPTVLRSSIYSITSGWTPNMFAYSEAAANRYSYSATVATVLAVATGLISFALMRAAVRGDKR